MYQLHIYVYGSNSMFFPTVCRWVRHLSADVGPVTSAPKADRSKSASSPKIVKKISVNQTQDILLEGLQI